MSKRTKPPFRADHVGSLLRPPAVVQARTDAAAGRITPAERRAIEDRAVAEVVEMQESIGLQSATDGEFRRATWHMDFIYRLGGVRPGDETLRIIARELVLTVRNNVTIDWTLRENVRAQLRVLVKRILRKHGYPPDKQEKATVTVLEQAVLLSAEWAVT